VLAMEIANPWLSESNALLANYFVDGSLPQRERVVFACDEQPSN
jgi:hypothetical protein